MSEKKRYSQIKVIFLALVLLSSIFFSVNYVLSQPSPPSISVIQTDGQLFQTKASALEKYLFYNMSWEKSNGNLIIGLNVNRTIYNFLKDAYQNPTLAKCNKIKTYIADDYPTATCNQISNKLTNYFQNGWKFYQRGVEKGVVNTTKNRVTITLPSIRHLDKIRIGENTLVYEYQNVSKVNYQGDWFDLNATLYVYNDSSWNNTINNIFVFDRVGDDKFGANVTGFSGVQRFKYVLESNIEIREKSTWIYSLDKIKGSNCGSISCFSLETHRMNFQDICSQKINKTLIGIEGEINGSVLLDPDCKFNKINSNTLEIEFYAMEENGIISVDPTIEIDDVNSYGSINNNVSTNAYPSAYAKLFDNSVVLYVNFDLNSSTDSYDLSNSSNDGTVSNSIKWNNNGVYGGSYSFDRTLGASINLGNNLDFNLTHNFTVAGWIKPVNDTKNYAMGIFRIGVNYGREQVKVEVDMREAFGRPFLKLTVDDGTNSDSIDTATRSIKSNQWQHFACVSNETDGLLCYLNGVQSGQFKQNPLTQDVGTFNANIGYIDVNSNSFNGSIDEFMVFNRPLNSSEVLDIFNNQSARFFQPATQLFTNVNFTQGGSDNRINVTYNTTLNFGTTIQLRLIEYNNGVEGSTSDWQSLVDGDNQLNQFNISTSTNNLTLEFNYTTDSNKFYTSMLRDNIVVDTWIGATGVTDNEYPQFSNYWDSSPTNQNEFGYFNTTITETNGTAILEINGVNYTASNTTATLFNVTINLTTAGDFDYYWGSWGNGTDNNYNISVVRSYTVDAGTQLLERNPSQNVKITSDGGRKLYGNRGSIIDSIISSIVNRINGAKRGISDIFKIDDNSNRLNSFNRVPIGDIAIISGTTRLVDLTREITENIKLSFIVLRNLILFRSIDSGLSLSGDVTKMFGFYRFGDFALSGAFDSTRFYQGLRSIFADMKFQIIIPGVDTTSKYLSNIIIDFKLDTGIGRIFFGQRSIFEDFVFNINSIRKQFLTIGILEDFKFNTGAGRLFYLIRGVGNDINLGGVGTEKSMFFRGPSASLEFNTDVGRFLKLIRGSSLNIIGSFSGNVPFSKILVGIFLDLKADFGVVRTLALERSISQIIQMFLGFYDTATTPTVVGAVGGPLQNVIGPADQIEQIITTKLDPIIRITLIGGLSLFILILLLAVDINRKYSRR